MANKNYILNLSGQTKGRRGLRIVAVDTAESANTFTDNEGSGFWVADDDYQIIGIQPQGSTAPSSVTVVQPVIDTIPKPDFINLTAVYNAQASMQDRLGTLLGKGIRRGSTLRLVSKA